MRDGSNDEEWPKEVPFGDVIDAKCFQGIFLFHTNSNGNLVREMKKIENAEQFLNDKR